MTFLLFLFTVIVLTVLLARWSKSYLQRGLLMEEIEDYLIYRETDEWFDIYGDDLED